MWVAMKSIFRAGFGALLQLCVTCISIGTFLSGTQAQAALLPSWNLNLNVVGGVGAANIAALTVDGFSQLDQTIVAGSGMGNAFGFQGSLGWVQYQDVAANGPFGFGLPVGQTDLFLSFQGLTGQLDLSGNGTFNPNVGTAALYLGQDGSLTPQPASILLASFLFDSGSASDIAYFDGGGANPFFNLNFKLLSSLSGLLTDDQGHALLAGSLFSFSVDGLLDPSVFDNPSALVGSDGVSTSVLLNLGDLLSVDGLVQSNPTPTSVPEPASLFMLTMGLLLLCCTMRFSSFRGRN